MPDKKTQNPPAIDDIKTFSKIQIRGTVVRKVRTAKALVFVVASRNNDAKKFDYPRFVAFDNLGELDKSFTYGERVTVIARMQTSKKYPQGTLVPESVTIEKPKIDAAFNNEEFLPDCNVVTIRGTLAQKPRLPNENTALMTIRVAAENGQTNFLQAIGFGRTALLASRKNKGDIVECVGYIRTKPNTDLADETNSQSLTITQIR